MKTHLVIPAYAATAHRSPKWSKRVTITEEPRLLRRLMPGIDKSVALAHRHGATLNAKECRATAASLRNAASAEHGDAGFPNRFPVTGGTCEHWPESVRLPILRHEQHAAQWDSIARAWHAYAGKRASTFSATA